MLKFLFFVMAVLICLVKTHYSYTKQLYKKLLIDQDPRARPALNVTIPTDVYVAMHLLSLREIVETQQLYHINVWMEFIWQDEIRIWNPLDYGGLRVIYPNAGDTWVPRVLISNSVERRDIFSGVQTVHAILANGNTRWYPGSIISASCELDLTYFPFDFQNCYVQLIAQHFEWDVNLIALEDTIDISDYTKNCEWELVSTKGKKSSIPNEISSLGVLFFNLTFRRHTIFYVINAFAPVFVISLLAPLVFVLPEESGERASFSVTLLLSQTVYLTSVAGKLPQCSQPLPLLVSYIFVMLIHSGLCVVCTVVQLKFIQIHSDKTRNHLPEETADSVREPQQSLIITGYDETASEKKVNGINLISYEDKVGDTRTSKLDIIREFNDAAYHVNNIHNTENKRISVADKEKFIRFRSFYNGRVAQLLKKLINLRTYNWNLILFAFFYISWFVVSIYFLFAFLSKE